jgi:hypothetical protein
VRWHGARPALLWELRRHDADDTTDLPPVTITIPGLDASFRTTDATGETLLAGPGEPERGPVAAGGDSPTDPGASFT